jgi:hypothetical protein
MTDKEFDDYIQTLKGKLPLPSDWKGDIVIPHGIYGYNEETGTPLFGSITFTKEVHDGIVIGWKLKEKDAHGTQDNQEG